MSTVIGSLIFVLILVAGLTTIYTLFGYYNSYNAQLLQNDQSALQRQETALSVTGFTFGSQPTPTTIATSTSVTLSTGYVAVTITNGQSSATPNPFQQMITWNPSSYSSYEASNLGNIRFCTTSSCGTELYAWLESCSSTPCASASSATAWVKLTSAISANGALTIYMVFESSTTNFDGNYWGEAPTLSTTYAQYDNGANVFAAYFNGNTATGDFSVYTGLMVAQVTGVTGPGGVTINAIQISGTAGAHTAAFVFNTALSNVAVVTEASFQLAGDLGDGTGITGLMSASSATSSSINGIGVGMGFDNYYFYQAYESAGAVTEPENGVGASVGTWAYGGVNYTGKTSTSFSSYIAPQLYNSNGGDTNTYSINPIPLSAATNIYLGAIGGSSAVDIYFNWGRARFYPPGGVMPSTSFGSVQTSTAGSPVATAYSFQNKLVYSQGLWWAFYSDGTHIDYETSPDGSTWSGPTVVTSSSDSTKGYDFSIWTSGSTIYYVLTATGVSASFLWQYGTLQSSGLISWTNSQTSQTTSNTVYAYDSIATDSSGNLWIALNTFDGTNTHIEVWKYTLSSSTWSKSDDISPVSSDEVGILVPLSSGDMALIYGEGSVTSQIKIISYTPASGWSSTSTAVSPPSDYLLFSSSATAIQNTVYFAGLASTSTGVTTGTVKFWSFTSGGTSTSSETTIQATTAAWSSSIAEMPTKTLVLYYGNGANLYEESSENYGLAWSSAQTISSSETSVAGVTSTDGSAGVLWTSGSSSPYNVRFAALPVLSVFNSSPFAVQMISLYILDTTTNSLTHFDTNPSGTDVTGSFDYWIGAGEAMSIPLSSNFAWTTSQSYVITVASDQGVLESFTLTSPT